jgi:hypothetical protein
MSNDHGREEGTAGEDARLADIPLAVRAHPLFRQGYNRGYDARAHEEFLAGRRAGSLPAAGGPADPPVTFDVTTGGLRHRLAPGMRAARDVGTMASEHFSTETPCCGRRITLPVPGQDQTWPAMCCHCRVLFTAALAQEEPDGFGDEPPHIAIFIVEQLNVAVAQHRAGRWERAAGRNPASPSPRQAPPGQGVHRHEAGQP